MDQYRQKYTVTAILTALGVARSTYYRWMAEGISYELPQVERDLIELCKQTRYRYGHRKIKKLLKSKYQTVRHRNTIQRLMQKHNLQCRIKKKRKWKSQGESVVIAPNLLARNFTASAPNQKWVTDITYIQYGSSTLYLSAIMDLFNNEIVAYRLYSHQQTSLVVDTLYAALEKRGYPEGVIVHSDQGSVYTSHAYQQVLQQKHLVSSMSRRGNCWDNAVIESFHSSIKSEEFQFVKFNSLPNLHVIEKVNNYIQHYNEDRILTKLGYLSPREFGAQAA